MIQTRAVSLTPPMLARMVVDPVPTGVTTPLDTVAIPIWSLTHSTMASTIQRPEA